MTRTASLSLLMALALGGCAHAPGTYCAQDAQNDTERLELEALERECGAPEGPKHDGCYEWPECCTVAPLLGPDVE